jgi:hypothetical protein
VVCLRTSETARSHPRCDRPTWQRLGRARDHLAPNLTAEYPSSEKRVVINPRNDEWFFNNAGGAMGALNYVWHRVHVSITECLIIFGTPLLKNKLSFLVLGWIPAMMPFGLADHLSSTLDFPPFYHVVRISGKEMVSNLLIGKI